MNSISVVHMKSCDALNVFIDEIPLKGIHVNLVCEDRFSSFFSLFIYGDEAGTYILQKFEYDVRRDIIHYGSELWRKKGEVKVKKKFISRTSLSIGFDVRESDRVKVKCAVEVRSR